MLLAGDEFLRTQQGNNNAWCQDNEISWVDWEPDEQGRDLLEFTRQLIRIFHQHPVLRRRKFFQGRQIRGAEIKDVSWFRPDGQEMAEDDWRNDQARSLAVRLAGDAIDEVDERGRRVTDDTLLLLLNAHHRAVSFTLPAHRQGVTWEQLLDTRESFGRRRTRRATKGGGTYRVEARSLALFRQESGGAEGEPEEEWKGAARVEPGAGREEAEPAAAHATPEAYDEEPPVESVYCANAGGIVALDAGFCRACSRQVTEGDGVHRPVTPELLGHLSYATTEVPDPEPRPEPADETRREAADAADEGGAGDEDTAGD